MVDLKKLITRWKKVTKNDASVQIEDGKPTITGVIKKKLSIFMERTAVGMTLLTGGIFLAERNKKAEAEEKAERKKWEDRMEARSIRIEENQHEAESWGKRLEQNQQEMKQAVEGIRVSLDKGKN